jgi:hypothetical protein
MDDGKIDNAKAQRGEGAKSFSLLASLGLWFNSSWLRLATLGIPAAKAGPQKILQKAG